MVYFEVAMIVVVQIFLSFLVVKIFSLFLVFPLFLRYFFIAYFLGFLSGILFFFVVKNL